MSGNYVGIGNYADAEDLAMDDESAEAAEVEVEDGQDTRLAGVIIND
jgi:hypothetical protein